MPNPTSQELVQITKHIMRVLDEWGLSGQDIINVLALPKNIRARHLDRFRDDTPFPADEEIMQRIEHIAGIADALRTSFPRNAHMGIHWLRTPHKRFKNLAPLHVVTEQGLTGLRIVRAELDCAFGWNETS